MAGLGKSFAAEVERTIALVREFPEAGTSVGSKRRRVRVARFPYSIVYRQDTDAIVIVAVLISADALVTGGDVNSTLTTRCNGRAKQRRAVERER